MRVFKGETSISLLWQVFLTEHGATFALVSNLVLVLLVLLVALWLVPKLPMKIAAKLGVWLIIAMGVVFHGVYAVNVDAIFGDNNLGRPAMCPVFQYDPEGRPVYVEKIWMIDGQPTRVAVHAKVQYQGAVPSVSGRYRGVPSVGMLLRNPDIFGDTFPMFCIVERGEEADEIHRTLARHFTPFPMRDVESYLRTYVTADELQRLRDENAEARELARRLERHIGGHAGPLSQDQLTEVLNYVIHVRRAPSGAALALQFRMALEQSGWLNALPMIELPGEPHWYRLPEPEGEGEGDGQEGDAEAEGEGDGDGDNGHEGADGGQGIPGQGFDEGFPDPNKRPGQRS